MSKIAPEIPTEKSEGHHSKASITSIRSEIVTFVKCAHRDEIFQIRSTCFFTPDPPVALILDLLLSLPIAAT